MNQREWNCIALSADVPIRINSLLHHFRDIGHRI